MPPTPRPALFDVYWRFAAERQSIFFRRLTGSPPPWTEDPILRSYKFCNTYRASDRVSQFLVREVIYQPDFSPDDTVLRTVLFRLFSKPATWQLLEKVHGPVTARDLDPEAYSATLETALGRGETIYTNAFILSAGAAFGHARKHRNHLALVDRMRHEGLTGAIARAQNMKAVYDALIGYPMIGPFLAYQIAVDLNYGEVVDFDEDDFTMPGPGAQRGITKCFADTGGWSGPDLIAWMVERQESEFARLGLEFQTLWGRRLHAIDCQSLFCETDKYARAAFPELRSNRVRIKAQFAPTPEPLVPFYPPKWGINAAAAAAARGWTITPSNPIQARFALP